MYTYIYMYTYVYVYVCAYLCIYVCKQEKTVNGHVYVRYGVCVCYMLYSHNMFVSVVYVPNVSMGFYGWNTSFAA